MSVEYAGKDGPDHLLLDVTTWDGRRHVTERVRAERDQRCVQLHPRHITAYAIEGGARSCLSPSLQGFSDVAKRFRLGRCDKGLDDGGNIYMKNRLNMEIPNGTGF